MADQPAQNYANHRRFIPLYHFFALPVLLLNVVGSIVHAVLHPDSKMGWLGIISSIAILVVGISVRFFATRVQDRIIRLEMRLRLERVLPQESRASIEKLSVPQLVALRFASDAELPGLVGRTLAGELAKPNDIKKAITSWQADHLRA